MKPLDQCWLYTFIDTDYLHGRTPFDIARKLCVGGADLIQLRAKKSTAAEVLQMADEILPILRDAGVGLVINDHAEVAEKLGADLCHLGQEDFAAVSRPRTPFGLSTHSPAQAEQAVKENPAYIAIGPVYATATKPGVPPVTLDYVRWAATNVKIPWFAIGGINLNTLNDVLDVGAQRICVVSAILNAPDVAEACREFRKRLPS
ncbi:MAG TPA: thiamine phosphate synthase [Verrucomicrobiae bacterium]|jgi:thiamine-phosphate pyrophosphorylase